MKCSLEPGNDSAGGREVMESAVFMTPDKAIVPGKKQGRPKKEETETKPVQWTIEMIRALLEQKEELKDEFFDSKDKMSLARGWSKIVLHIQAKFNVVISPGQVKFKYQLLQKAYRTQNAAEKQTGNAPIPT
jgi:hypothetical protein